MTKFAEARFVIRAVNKTQKSFSQINRSVDNMGRRFSKLGGGLSKFGALMGAAFVGKQITDTITKFEKLEASLRTITGSADNAAVAFGFIQDFASKTPFQLEEVTDAFIKLKALGLTPSAEALTSYGNTASAMGKSLNQMIEAVADAGTGEFERLKEFGIKARSEGDKVTFTFQGVKTTIGKNAAEIESYLRSIGDVQFGGAMAEQASTLNVALSNMGDAFSKLVKAIGDAGLTDLLISIASAIKWVAEKITSLVPIAKLGFEGIIVGVKQFANSFIARLIGLGDAIGAFFSNIANRFDAFGKDIGAFFEDPLSGISFENTKRAFSAGLADSMSNAYDEMVQTANTKNEQLDASLASSADKFIAAQTKKAGALSEILKTPGGKSSGQDKANKDTEKFNKLQREAQRIIDGTRTSQENYNEQLGLLNKLLAEGFINQDTYNRAVIQAQEELQKSSNKNIKSIKDQFADLGQSMEDNIVNSLSNINGKFEGFGDFFKGFLSDLHSSFIRFAVQNITGSAGGGSSGIFNNLLSSAGGLFSGGASFGGIGSMISGLLPGFAKGGSFMVGGNPGTDNNLLSINNRPVARVSASERIDVVPNGRNATSTQTREPVIVNQTINLSTGVQQTVRAEIMRMLPAIEQHTTKGVEDARARGAIA